jgi:hypothetical protein
LLNKNNANRYLSEVVLDDDGATLGFMIDLRSPLFRMGVDRFLRLGLDVDDDDDDDCSCLRISRISFLDSMSSL